MSATSTKAKPNTCQPSSLHSRLERQLAGIEKHLAQFPHDKLSHERAAKIRSQLGR
jgi:hypothetical protein